LAVPGSLGSGIVYIGVGKLATNTIPGGTSARWRINVNRPFSLDTHHARQCPIELSALKFAITPTGPPPALSIHSHASGSTLIYRRSVELMKLSTNAVQARRDSSNDNAATIGNMMCFTVYAP
jgi:hypothetical protein